MQILKGIVTEKELRTISAFSASSPALAKELTKHIQKAREEKEGTLKILEAGFGPGTITQAIEEQMRPILNSIDDGDTLDAVEWLQFFYDYAVLKFPKYEFPHVRLHCGKFEDWNPEDVEAPSTFDMVFATLPFTRFPLEIIAKQLDKIVKLLKPGGYFSYISLVGAEIWGQLKVSAQAREEFREKLRYINAWKQSNFELVEPGREYELVVPNLTSAWVYHLRKKEHVE